MKDGNTARAWIAALAAVTTAGAIAGCDLSNPGTPVPPARLNFPIALALAGSSASGPTTLLVANSNFDLRFASGTLQSYSIEALTAEIDAMIGSGACQPRDATVPTFCIVPDERLADGDAGLLLDEVLVGSHMDGLALTTNADRAILPVRSGRGVVTWVELSPSGDLSCGGPPDDPSDIESCDQEHRATDETIGRSLGLTLPSDPVAVAVVPGALVAPGLPDGEADFIVIAHRNGSASLFLDQHTAFPGQPPQYLHTLTGIPNDIVSIEADPSGLVWLTSAATIGTRATRDLVALGIRPPPTADTFEARLFVAQSFTLRGIDDGLDTRDIAIDTTRAATDPLRMWVLARRPEAVITVDFDIEPFATGEAPLGPIHSVGFGPSRLVRFGFDFSQGSGTPDVRQLLVATCFDSRNLFIVDPDLGTIATVAGFDGPFEIVVDEARARAYVADFRFSVLWVVDLTPLATGGSPQTLARIGSGHSPSVFR